MSIGFVDKVKGFLLDPTQTLITHRDERLGDALRYSVILLVIYGALAGVVIDIAISGLANLSAEVSPLGTGGLAVLGAATIIVGTIISIIILGIIVLFIAGIILHIFVYIAGGRKDISTTLRAIIYSYTPKMLFGWIPLIGLITELWSLALVILAIRELHEISTTRAVIAVILSILFISILIVISLVVIIYSEQTTTLY